MFTLFFAVVFNVFFYKSISCFLVRNHIIGTDKKGVILTNTWSVKLKVKSYETTSTLNEKADNVAKIFDMANLGQVAKLTGHYLFVSNSVYANWSNFESLRLDHEDIEWYMQQEVLQRTKRAFNKRNYQKKSLKNLFSDPLYIEQWHLHNKKTTGIDCNVTGVWKNGITGKGVVVAIVDDGVQWKHPDLIDNFCSEGSFDLNSNDDDPTPTADEKEDNKHGTRCAGEVAAVTNDICGVGVAYQAKFSGIRVLDGPMTDSLEATAFNKRINVNDVYSCSWGPEDDGKTVDGPRGLAQAALKHGVIAGRSGFGSIFVVASGNGGMEGDNCNYDGYASSIYTITIAAVDEFGRTPAYAEECVSMLASTVSSGGGIARSITTTDWLLGHNPNLCTNEHSGTSAATPLVSGMVALMLEARPCLTWRDVQHIIVMTATPIYKLTQYHNKQLWHTNKAGFSHSNNHGFGLLDSWKLVNAARTWNSVPWLTSLEPYCPVNDYIIPNNGTSLILESFVTSKETSKHLINTLEYVVITISLSHPSRGNLKFVFTCPSGTTSIIPTRKKDTSSDGLQAWTFSTVRCWGEQAYGKYQLEIIDTKKQKGIPLGKLIDWKVVLYGSQMSSSDIIRRKEIIAQSLSGEFVSPIQITVLIAH